MEDYIGVICFVTWPDQIKVNERFEQELIHLVSNVGFLSNDGRHHSDVCKQKNPFRTGSSLNKSLEANTSAPRLLLGGSQSNFFFYHQRPEFSQLENSGDPLDFDNPHKMSYWTCVYFLIVTMSTVGYGDVACLTFLGRTFMVFFILVGLVSYSLTIPSFLLFKVISRQGYE